MQEYLVVTNNPLVRDALYPVVYVDGGVGEVLNTTGEFLSRGHRLLSHPLDGSVKPWMSRCKSVLISREAAGIDRISLEMMGSCLSFLWREPMETLCTEVPEHDMQLVDFDLLKSGLAGLGGP
jgi:hypothetical protein